MQSAVKYVGVITTDANLVVRGWDQWLVEATGLTEDRVLDQPLLGLFPEIEQRGIARRLKRVLEDGVVEILAPAFHQYFIRCAARGALPHFDVMQQHVSISPMRDAAGIGGLIITIEDVTARRVRERELAAQLNSQDETIRLRAARILAEDAEDAAPLMGALDDDSWQVRQAAVRGVSRAMDEDALARLIETVRDHHTDIGRLNAALSALVSSRLDAVPHLTPLLADPHADVRIYTALTLGNLRDARATGTLVPLLEDSDANVRFHAIEALGRIGSRDALLPLMRVVEMRDPFLSFATLDALAAIGEPSVAPAIERLLQNDVLAASAADALAAVGDERSAAAIATALVDERLGPVTAARALAAIYTRLEDSCDEGQLVADTARAVLPETVVAKLAGSVRRAGAADATAIALVLGWLPFEGVEDALALLLANGAARPVAVDALVAHGTRATAALMRALESEEADVRRAAALGLGRIGNPAASAALCRLLQDDDPATVIAAAGALGAIGNPDAFVPLLAVLTHDHAAVRHAAVSAINSIGHPQTPARARELIGSSDERLRESGARIAGYFGYPECLDGLIRLMSDSSELVRRTAIEHLGFFDDDRALPALAYALSADSPQVRASASRALAHAEHAGVADLLAAAVADTDARVRYQAVQAVATQQFTDFGARLQSIAREDDAIPVRIAAVRALGSFRDASAAAVLTELAAHPETDLACAAIAALGGLPTAHAHAPLEQALLGSAVRVQLAALDAISGAHAGALLPALQRVGTTSDDAEVAQRAISTLAAHADDVVIDALIGLLANPSRREFVINALASVGARRVARIADGLASANPDIRLATVATLARMKRPEASRALGTAVNDVDPMVRFAATQALGRLDLAADWSAAPL
jgi:HEAT repeat protein